MNQQLTDKKKRVFLGLGSNIDPTCYLPEAIRCLGEYLEVNAVSTIWQTRAVGSSGPDYLNAVIEIETELSRVELKQSVLSHIESALDRVRTEDKYADRTIDIDILIYDQDILDGDLWVQPHVFVPLSELFPDLVNPNTGENLGELSHRFPKDQMLTRPDLMDSIDQLN